MQSLFPNAYHPVLYIVYTHRGATNENDYNLDQSNCFDVLFVLVSATLTML